MAPHRRLHALALLGVLCLAGAAVDASLSPCAGSGVFRSCDVDDHGAVLAEYNGDKWSARVFQAQAGATALDASRHALHDFLRSAGWGDVDQFALINIHNTSVGGLYHYARTVGSEKVRVIGSDIKLLLNSTGTPLFVHSTFRPHPGDDGAAAARFARAKFRPRSECGQFPFLEPMWANVTAEVGRWRASVANAEPAAAIQEWSTLQFTASPLIGESTESTRVTVHYRRQAMQHKGRLARVVQCVVLLPKPAREGYSLMMEETERGDCRYTVLSSAKLRSGLQFKIFLEAAGQAQPRLSPTIVYPVQSASNTDRTSVNYFMAPSSDTEIPWLKDGTTLVSNAVSVAVDASAPDGTATPVVFGGQAVWKEETPLADDSMRAAANQLFYSINYLHDTWYASGFNEVSGNAQNDNSDLGGAGGDPVVAEFRDYSFNEDSVLVPPDGLSPRLQLSWRYFNTKEGGTVECFNDRVVYLATLFKPDTFQTASGSGVMYVMGPNDVDGAACQPIASNIGSTLANNIAILDASNDKCLGKTCCPLSQRVRNLQVVGAVAVVLTHTFIARGVTDDLMTVSPPPSIPVMLIRDEDAPKLVGDLRCGLQAPLRTPRDAAMDFTIVAHEYTHIVANRIIGDSLGLNNIQGQALAEAWADVCAVVLNTRIPQGFSIDNVLSQWFTIGSYLSDLMIGIRRFPYSSSASVNPLDYSHMRPEAIIPSSINGGTIKTTTVTMKVGGQQVTTIDPYEGGEIIANMYWNCFVQFAKASAAASVTLPQIQKRFLDVMILSWRLTSPNPTFITARNAFFAAFKSLYPENFQACSSEFSLRGMGPKARAPPSDSWSMDGLQTDFVTLNAAPPTASAVSVVLSSVRLHDLDSDQSWDSGEGLSITLNVTSLCSQQARVNVSVVFVTENGAPANDIVAQMPPESILVGQDCPATGTGNGVRSYSQLFNYTFNYTSATPKMVAHLNAQVRDDDKGVSDSLKRVIPFPVNIDVCRATTEEEDVTYFGRFRYHDWEMLAECAGGADVASPWTVRFNGQQYYYYIPDMESNCSFILQSDWLRTGQTPVVVRFSTSFALESGRDGVVVEAMSASSPVWVDVLDPSLYNSAFAASSPYAGRKAFTGIKGDVNSFSFTSDNVYTFNIASFKDQSIKLRFRLIGDESYFTPLGKAMPSPFGFAIGNFRIGNLVTPAFPRATAHGACRSNPLLTVTPGPYIAIDLPPSEQAFRFPRFFTVARPNATLMSLRRPIVYTLTSATAARAVRVLEGPMGVEVAVQSAANQTAQNALLLDMNVTTPAKESNTNVTLTATDGYSSTNTTVQIIVRRFQAAPVAPVGQPPQPIIVTKDGGINGTELGVVLGILFGVLCLIACCTAGLCIYAKCAGNSKESDDGDSKLNLQTPSRAMGTPYDSRLTEMYYPTARQAASPYGRRMAEERMASPDAHLYGNPEDVPALPLPEYMRRDFAQRQQEAIVAGIAIREAIVREGLAEQLRLSPSPQFAPHGMPRGAPEMEHAGSTSPSVWRRAKPKTRSVS